MTVLYRGYLSLVDRLPLPSLRTQKIIAFLSIVVQGAIAVTGSVVRVTASGLGCPTWPQCFPGSMVPVGVSSNVNTLHQIVEFGNRLLTFVVVLVAAAIVLAVTRARRRPEVIAWAWVMPAGTVVQAIIGGITVLAGLLWWTVAIHLVASMLLVWLAVILYTKVGEPDDGVVVQTLPQPLRWLTALCGVALAGVLIAGTMVTGAARMPATRASTGRCLAWTSISPTSCTCTRNCSSRTWLCWSASHSRCTRCTPPTP